MNWLDRGQPAMIEALDRGPDYLPPDLFAGSRQRVLAGMKVHANTISHARLVALEETFPRTLELAGHDRFNQHSRLFIEQPGVTGRPLADIGFGFDRFLSANGEDGVVSEMARFEWIWLQAYHAAEADPLRLADLAGIDPADLMELPVRRHPAACASAFDRQLHQLLGSEVPGLAEAEAILVIRPQAEILVAPATGWMVALLDLAGGSQTIGNLFTLASEQAIENGSGRDEDLAAAMMQALAALLEAGAIVRA